MTVPAYTLLLLVGSGCSSQPPEEAPEEALQQASEEAPQTAAPQPPSLPALEPPGRLPGGSGTEGLAERDTGLPLETSPERERLQAIASYWLEAGSLERGLERWGLPSALTHRREPNMHDPDAEDVWYLLVYPWGRVQYARWASREQSALVMAELTGPGLSLPQLGSFGARLETVEERLGQSSRVRRSGREPLDVASHIPDQPDSLHYVLEPVSMGGCGAMLEEGAVLTISQQGGRWQGLTYMTCWN